MALVLRKLVPLVLCAVSAALLAQQPAPSPSANAEGRPIPKMDEQTAKDRRYAMELYSEGKYVAAEPWLEKVLKVVPDDVVSQERLGTCLLAQATATDDPAARKALRIRAREELLRARKMGDNSDLLNTLLAGLPEDGRDPVFSSNAEVDRLIKVGEAAFAAGQYDAAKDAYIKAVILDPTNYGALLFVGDVYFAKNDAFAAGEWFSRAVQADPTQETAYRYWGDTLIKQRKFAAAREKYITAVICDPYERKSWNGVSNFARLTKQSLTWYKLQSPHSFQATDKGGNIALDPETLAKKDGSSAWMSYPLTRAAWQSQKFAKEFPNEKQYRHSLKEESEALSAVAEAAEALSTGKHPEVLNEELTVVVKLHKSGLLDSYILLNAADQGIAQDYPGYRAAHRDLLTRYLSEVVLPPAPADGSTP